MLLIGSGDMNDIPYNSVHVLRLGKYPIKASCSEYLISYWETINRSYSDALIQIFHIVLICIAKASALHFIVTACMDF